MVKIGRATIIFLCCGILQLLLACHTPMGETITTNSLQQPVGYSIYRQHCNLCHGADGKYGFSGAADLSKSILDKTAVMGIIKNGQKTMTPFGGVLSEKEIGEVADYAMTLRGK